MEIAQPTMAQISQLLKPATTNRHDQNFLKSFSDLTNEALFKIRGHKNQTIIFFTFKRN